MKTRVVILILSSLLCIGICLYSNHHVNSVMESVIEDVNRAEKLLSKNDAQAAKETAEGIRRTLKDSESFLESLVPHEDLHDLSVQIEDVVLSVSIGDMDDCKKALALIRENAEHLIRHEALSLGNIF